MTPERTVLLEELRKRVLALANESRSDLGDWMRGAAPPEEAPMRGEVGLCYATQTGYEAKGGT